IDAVFANTTFAWMGATDGGRFYFRIYNPKILIEYDLTSPFGVLTNGNTDHTHLIVRSPDKTDYGAFAELMPSIQEHLRSSPNRRGGGRAPPRPAPQAGPTDLIPPPSRLPRNPRDLPPTF